MANSEYLMQLGMIEQEARRIEEQINLINQQVVELKNLDKNLLDIDKGKEKEILAGLGRGIFIKSDIKDKKLFVNIGSGVVLRKSCAETQEIIEKQISQLEEIKAKLVDELGKLNLELNKIIKEAQKQAQEEKEDKHEHEHEED